jgi:hypothetical protein
MRNLITMVTLLTLLGGQPTCADQRRCGIVGRARNQIVTSLRAQEMRLIDAPIGHRQPHANGAEDAAVDRKLIILPRPLR